MERLVVKERVSNAGSISEGPGGPPISNVSPPAAESKQQGPNIESDQKFTTQME